MTSCRKIPYPNRATAKRAARSTPASKVYLCHCGQWHLSSKSKRQVAQLRRRFTERED